MLWLKPRFWQVEEVKDTLPVVSREVSNFASRKYTTFADLFTKFFDHKIVIICLSISLNMCFGEHSAILLTFIKQPFLIKIFVLSFMSGCLRHV